MGRQSAGSGSGRTGTGTADAEVTGTASATAPNAATTAPRCLRRRDTQPPLVDDPVVVTVVRHGYPGHGYRRRRSSRTGARTREGATLSEQDRPNPSAAPVCKLRLRYAKRGKLRFTSHRDVARAFERALRRAGLPMAYSQGFSPHPKVSWAGAAPTGCASEAEYLELSLVERVDPELVRRELDAALPEGLHVVEAVPAGPGNLTERIEACAWRIELPGVPVEALQKAVDALLAASEVSVERMTKDGPRLLDARAAIVSATVHGPAEVSPATAVLTECGILDTVVRQVSPAVRPDDVLSALGVVAGLERPVPAKATRLAQGWLDGDGGLVDPLGPDRDGPEAAGGDVPRSPRDDVAGRACGAPGVRDLPVEDRIAVTGVVAEDVQGP